jgi:hypothetical protein
MNLEQLESLGLLGSPLVAIRFSSGCVCSSFMETSTSRGDILITVKKNILCNPMFQAGVVQRSLLCC